MTTLATRPFSDDFLLSFSHAHVAYEVQMFLTRKSASIVSDDAALLEWLKNSTLEAYVLHLRNLLDFLYPRGRLYGTDVIAEDYFANASWKGARPELIGKLKQARERADKEMAHLTTGRLDPGTKEKVWNIHELQEELMPALRAFVQHADAGRLDPAVSKAVTAASTRDQP